MIAWLAIVAFAAPPREVGAAPDAHAQRPVWSPDGTRLAWEANDVAARRVTLFTGPVSTAAWTPVRPVAMSTSGLTSGFSTVRAATAVFDAAWGPSTSGRLVCVGATDERDHDLYLDTGTALAPSPGPDGGPAWSPDGRYVVFTSARTGEGDLYLLDMTQPASPPRRLTSDVSASEVWPAWSPDSVSLAWTGHGPTGDTVWLSPSLDSAPVPLVRWQGSQLHPSFSPDGSRIAWYADRDVPGRFDLWVVARAGGDPRRLVDDVVANARGPTWSPTGQSLVVVRNDDQRFDPLVWVPATGGAATVLDLGTVNHGDLDVTRGPDGQTWLAWTAQGLVDEQSRAYRRLFVAPIVVP